MASLILSSEIAAYQQAVNDHFDTFKRQITIHKEPIKTISTSNSPHFGYEEDSNIEKVIYTPRSSTFFAIIKYFSYKEAQSVPEIKSTTADQFVEIKVKEDARNYIISDVTEKITFDNKSFNLIDSEIVKNYQGLIYYGYYLKEIK